MDQERCAVQGSIVGPHGHGFVEAEVCPKVVSDALAAAGLTALRRANVWPWKTQTSGLLLVPFNRPF